MKNTKRYLLGGLLTAIILMLGVFIQNKQAEAGLLWPVNIAATVSGPGHANATVYARINTNGTLTQLNKQSKQPSTTSTVYIGGVGEGPNSYCVYATTSSSSNSVSRVDTPLIGVVNVNLTLRAGQFLASCPSLSD